MRVFELRRLIVSASIAAIGILGCEDKPRPKPAVPAPNASAASDEAVLKAHVQEQARPAARNEPAAGGGALPAGHPPTGGAAPPPQPSETALPAGHPPIGNAAPAPAAPPAAGAADLKWDAPAEWVANAPANPMRKAQFVLPKAEGDAEDGDMIVFYFGRGEGGSAQLNIQRWRGQFSGPDGKPLGESDGKMETFTVGELKVTVLEVAGRFTATAMGGAAPAPAPKDNYRMLAAVVETPNGPWFFKGAGPSATMEKHRAAFRKLLESVRM